MSFLNIKPSNFCSGKKKLQVDISVSSWQQLINASLYKSDKMLKIYIHKKCWKLCKYENKVIMPYIAFPNEHTMQQGEFRQNSDPCQVITPISLVTFRIRCRVGLGYEVAASNGGMGVVVINWQGQIWHNTRTQGKWTHSASY